MGSNPIALISISSLHLHVQNSPPDGGPYLQGSGRKVPATLRIADIGEGSGLYRKDHGGVDQM